MKLHLENNQVPEDSTELDSSGDEDEDEDEDSQEDRAMELRERRHELSEFISSIEESHKRNVNHV